MRISDWSSDVCSSDLAAVAGTPFTISAETTNGGTVDDQTITLTETQENVAAVTEVLATGSIDVRSEEHTSELQSLMRISYAVFCLKKKKITDVPRTILHRITSLTFAIIHPPTS